MNDGKLFGVVPLYGLLISCGVLLAVYLCNVEAKRRRLPADLAIDMALWSLPLGVIGARAYYVAFRWELYAQTPLDALMFWQGGLAIYGAVMGGAAGLWLLSRRRKIAYGTLLDIVAPVLILAQGIGRWGNFFNGEAYGREVAAQFWQFFPISVFADGAWHMATFFYESVWDVAGFALLWRARRDARFTGHTFARYLLWYGAGRLVIEGLRTDSLMLSSVRVSQLVSLAMCASALGALIFKARRGNEAARRTPIYNEETAAGHGGAAPGRVDTALLTAPGWAFIALLAAGVALAAPGFILDKVWPMACAAGVFLACGVLLERRLRDAAQ